MNFLFIFCLCNILLIDGIRWNSVNNTFIWTTNCEFKIKTSLLVHFNSKTFDCSTECSRHINCKMKSS